MPIVRVSFVMYYTSKVEISFTELTSSYGEIGYDDDDDDDDNSNNYSIQLLFSNVLILDVSRSHTTMHHSR